MGCEGGQAERDLLGHYAPGRSRGGGAKQPPNAPPAWEPKRGSLPKEAPAPPGRGAPAQPCTPAGSAVRVYPHSTPSQEKG